MPYKDPEKRKSYMKKWREDNPDWHEKWNASNPEKRKEIAGKYRAANREKVNARSKCWKENNPDKVAEYSNKHRSEATKRQREWGKRNPRRVRSGQIRYKYGLSALDYYTLRKQQNNLCAICSRPEAATLNGKTRDLSVDHNHETGEVRGLLCDSCNKGIGHFKDDPEALLAAASYIRRGTS